MNRFIVRSLIVAGSCYCVSISSLFCAQATLEQESIAVTVVPDCIETDDSPVVDVDGDSMRIVIDDSLHYPARSEDELSNDAFDGIASGKIMLHDDFDLDDFNWDENLVMDLEAIRKFEAEHPHEMTWQDYVDIATFAIQRYVRLAGEHVRAHPKAYTGVAAVGTGALAYLLYKKYGKK